MVHRRRKMGNVTRDFGATEWTSNDGNVPATEDAGISVGWGMDNGSWKSV